jgi:hypothetical protein
MNDIPAPVNRLVGRIYWSKIKPTFRCEVSHGLNARLNGKKCGTVNTHQGKWYFTAEINGKAYNSLWNDKQIKPTYSSIEEAKSACAAYLMSDHPPNAKDQPAGALPAGKAE